MRGPIALLIEVAVLVAVLVAVVLGVDTAAERALVQSAARLGEAVRSADEVRAAVRSAELQFGIGVLALFVGRLVAVRRGRGKGIPAPLLVPAAIAAAGLGFAVQVGYGDPLHATGWPGPDFGSGVLIGGVVGGLLMALPIDVSVIAQRTKWALLVFIVGTFGALALFGSGPTGSGTRINLGGFQPLELVKLAFVAFLAVYLGARASAIRWQRNYLFQGLLRVPRPRLLLPAVLALVGLFLGLFLVRDLGPILILGLVFLTLFYVVTRSAPWVGLALAVLAAAIAVVAVAPEMVGSHSLTLRVRMWTDPWTNALAHGDQLASARWAIAAGGLLGQGFGAGAVGALPAGHTDLVLAHLAEELGVLGVAAYLVLLGAVVLSSFAVAALNRTPERVLLAGGLATLLFSQWLVIFAGTTGLLPLTGVVVPYLSSGRTSMVAFLVLVGVVGSLAGDGAPRARTEELDELRRGLLGVAGAAAAALIVGVAVIAWEGVALGPATSARGVVTTLADGTVVHRHDRRLEALLAQVPRGEIRDRNGVVLAGNDAAGARVHPLGAALGTLLGPPTADVFRPAWALERIHDVRLRGYGELEDGPSVWLARGEGGERVLFAVATRDERPVDRARAERIAGGDAVRQLPLPAPDLRPLVPVLHTSPDARPVALEAVVGTVDQRSVTLTLDARLQAAAVDALKASMGNGEAAAAVVIDVDSGEVLARAQVPDVDLDDAKWRARVLARDAKFLGVYGPWADKTGAVGVYQAGSVGKLVTALAAVRAGKAIEGAACATKGGDRFACTERDAEGPSFSLPHWKKPIHDFYRDRNHGRIDLVEAIAVSCNVFFGQLALDLGPEPFADLVAAGLDVGWSDAFVAGEPQSRTLALTGFGQGATALSVSQAARMGAAIGAGGVVRSCPPSLERGAACEERPLLDHPERIAVVLAGMQGTMERGTGRGLKKVDGVRIYGKTGTADSIGLRDEEPYGYRHRREGYRPHSWFVAVAEPAASSSCLAEGPGRLAVAVVVPRGGAGSRAAGPAAVSIVEQAHAVGYLGGGAP